MGGGPPPPAGAPGAGPRFGPPPPPPAVGGPKRAGLGGTGDMSVTSWLDRFQQRHTWAGLPLAVVYKYVDDQGAYLAALITYYGFLSVFPMLLLLVTVLGYALDGNPGLQKEVLNSALAQFPVIGTQLGGAVHQLQGNLLALIVGILGSLYGALGVAQAAQNAQNRIWAVPRGDRPNPFKSRLRSLLLMLVIGTGLLVTTGLSVLSVNTDAFGGGVGVVLRLLVVLVAVGVNVVLFIVAFRVLTARDVTVREVLPGSVLAAVGWQALQEWGNYFVAHQVHGSTPTYGSFAFVLGLIAYLYLAAVVVVVAGELNVVRTERLWPRSLLTPFTDDVTLTDADRRAYASYPATERHKENETVDVDFPEPVADPPPADG